MCGRWSREWLPDTEAPPEENRQRLRALYYLGLAGVAIVAALVRIVDGPPVVLAVLAFGFIAGIAGLLILRLTSWLPEISDQSPKPFSTTRSVESPDGQRTTRSRWLIMAGLVVAVVALAGSALSSGLIGLLGLAGLMFIASSASVLRSALQAGYRLPLGLRTRLLFVAVVGCLWVAIALNETARAL